MKSESKVLVLGSKGLVGSSLVRQLKNQGFLNLLTPTRETLDLTRQKEVLDYFFDQKPEYVFMAAAKVGGIVANNTYRADFIFQNLSLQSNVFEAAFKTRVKKLQFLGSSCIYPKGCPQPIKEEYLLTGPLEPTNEPYALAKIAGLKTVEAFRQQYGCQWFSLMPTNLYGPGDNYHPENSHVIPGMIQRLHKIMRNKGELFEVWGSGTPQREFLYIDDLARASVYLMTLDQTLPAYINVGTGVEIKISDLARLMARIMDFRGEIFFNTHFPDGTPRKVLDNQKIQKLGWKPITPLEDGLIKTIQDFNKMHEVI